jgi:FADH2 O2-dependent halogenase
VSAAGFDLAVLGSGFGGSLLAMVARRHGLRVILLERGGHPRFAIGESTSPLANLLLEELAAEYDLPRLLPLTSYGAWRRAYPDLTVGLKRGFSFYRQEVGQPFRPDPERARHLLVAASPADEVADTHWYRSEFDHFLVREAQSLGVEYVDRVSVDTFARTGEQFELRGTRGDRPFACRARFVVDATGPRGALSRLLALGERDLTGYPATQALFTHFVDVGRYGAIVDTGGAVPPFPPDDAALHHVFDGGWMWVLRFGNGVASAGFAAEDALAAELGLADGEGAWRRFLQRFPGIRPHLADARPILPWVHARRLGYRSARVVGPGWALLPSAAAFVDPLFSTGFPLTLLGIHRLGRLLRLQPGTVEWDAGLRRYARQTHREALAAARLVGACYAAFPDFPRFAGLSMLYFVAASYSEMARRLGRPELASAFLLQNRGRFRRAYRRHCRAARQGRLPAPDAVAADIEPYNIAGLCDPAKRNWYGVDLQDVVRGAEKLEVTPEAVRDFIARLPTG